MEPKVIRLEIRLAHPALLVALGLVVLAAASFLLWTSGSAAAGGDQEQLPAGIGEAAAIVGKRIHYQGRLEGATGPVQMTFTLYGDESGTEVLWEEAKQVIPDRGLINVELGDTATFSRWLFDGRELWLGVEVGDAGEMSPLQEILPVPYALSLRPGARIIGEDNYEAVLTVVNLATDGSWPAVYGKSYSPDAAGGHFAGMDSSSKALSVDGLFVSNKPSIVWFPGTLARERIGTSGLALSYHGDGLVRLDATTSGLKQIVIPLTAPAQMYGTPTELYAVELTFRCYEATSTNYLDKLIVYRQALGTSREFYTDESDYSCETTLWQKVILSPFVDPDLSQDDGIVTLELTAQMDAGDRMYVGGVKLVFYND